MPVLSSLLFIYFFPKMTLHNSTMCSPPSVSHNLPRPTTNTETSEDHKGVLKHPQMQQLRGAHTCSWVRFPGSNPIHRRTSVKPEGRLHEKSKGHSISRGHSRDKTGQVWSHRHCVSQLQWMLKHQLPGSCNKTHSQQLQYS